MAATTEKPMTIGALAKAADVGVETVRFYQRKGLLETPSSHGAYRHYGASHAERLRFIRRAQGIGFSLDEIADLLNLNDSRDHAAARAMAREKIDLIEERIAQLQTMADALRTLVKVCEHGARGMPCPIIRMALDDSV